MQTEKVLVIPRKDFDDLGSFQGFSTDSKYSTLINSADLFIDRVDAETDPNFKQLIPYILFHSGKNFLTYERGKSGGEDRLHNLISLGIGGHINPCDDNENHDEPFWAAVEREIDEELIVNDIQNMSFIGIINDDSNEVGKVHLGVLVLVSLHNMEITAKEDCIKDLKFLSFSQLKEKREQLEPWSRIVFEEIIEKALKSD